MGGLTGGNVSRSTPLSPHPWLAPGDSSFCAVHERADGQHRLSLQVALDEELGLQAVHPPMKFTQVWMHTQPRCRPTHPPTLLSPCARLGPSHAPLPSHASTKPLPLRTHLLCTAAELVRWPRSAHLRAICRQVQGVTYGVTLRAQGCGAGQVAQIRTLEGHLQAGTRSYKLGLHTGVTFAMRGQWSRQA